MSQSLLQRLLVDVSERLKRMRAELAVTEEHDPAMRSWLRTLWAGLREWLRSLVRRPAPSTMQTAGHRLQQT